MTVQRPAIINAVLSFDWDNAGRILLAVSGGADSVALLHALVASDVDCGVAHMDHQTRDGGSTEDAKWVEALAREWDVPYYGAAVDVPALAEASRESFEEVARRVRYDFLAEIAQLNGYDAVATAHHLDDQAETVLMRVLRGTSITGLGGIHAWSEWKGMPLMRPILNVTRTEIIDYLSQNGIAWREDATNNDESYFRNRIRHTLLPMLEESFNPGTKKALDRLARVARDEDALLAEWTSKALHYCMPNPNEIRRETFRELDPALRRRVMLQAIRTTGGIEELDRIDEAVEFVCWKGTGKRFDLGGGNQLSNGRDITLVIQQDNSESSEVPTELTIPGEATIGSVTIKVTALDTPPSVPLSDFCSPTRQVIAADNIGDALTVRYRKPGDRIAVYGMSGSRKLKDYFGDLGLPIEVRDSTPLLVYNEELVWVVGYAVSQDFAVSESTGSYVVIEVTDND